MQMHEPAHPGEVLKGLYLEPLGLTITEVAAALQVTRRTLSQLVNQKTGISPLMALKLAKAFHTTPELWLNLQRNYDLWHERKRAELSSVKVLVANE